MEEIRNDIARILHIEVEMEGASLLTQFDEKESLKTHKASYQKTWYQQNKERLYRSTIQFEKPDYLRLKHAAENHNMKLAEFIRKAVIAYLSKQYLTIEKAKLSELSIQLARIGNNINQVAKHANDNQYASEKHIAYLFQCLAHIEKDLVIPALTQPPTLLENIEAQMNADATFANEVEKLVTKRKKGGHKT